MSAAPPAVHYRAAPEEVVDVTGYNYPHFDGYVEAGDEAAEFGAFADHLHVGEPAPDAALTRLDDGATVRLSELWRHRPLVVEFGSFT